MKGRIPELDRSPLVRWAWLLGVPTACAVAVFLALVLPDVLTWLAPVRLRLFLQRGWPYWLALVAAVVVAWRPGRPWCLPAPADRRDVVAAGACMAIGVLLFILPDLLWWWRTGRLVWVRDNDDVLYLAVGSQAYFNHPWHLGDPSRARGGLALYSWLPCVPGVLLARALGLGPVGIGLAWRILAGMMIPLGWYLLLRRYAGLVATTALVLLLTADIGAMFGAPLEWQWTLLRGIARGKDQWLRMTYRPPGVQWRITTPGLIFLYFAAYLALLLRAREEPTRPRVATAGVAFGALFYVYFYYWTAAGLGLVLGALTDAGRRRVYLAVGILGGLIGLPAVLAGSGTRGLAAEAFLRFDLFRHVPRKIWVMLEARDACLLVACFVWVAWRRRDLLPVGTVAAAGWLLMNHQVVSGFVTQNDHWRMHVVGPMLTLLMALIVLEGLSRLTGRWRGLGLGALVVVAAADLTGGFVLREIVAATASSPLAKIAQQNRYHAQRTAPGAPRFEPNAVVAGDEVFVDWATILENQRPLYSDFLTRHSLSVGHAEWNMRAALNGYVRGQDRAAFAAEQRGRIANDFWGPWARSKPGLERLLAERLAAYDAVAADPVAALDRFGVRSAALRLGRRPPDDPAAGWHLVQAGPRWSLWERSPRSAPIAHRKPSGG